MAATSISISGALMIGSGCVSACGDDVNRTVRSLSSTCSSGATYKQIADIAFGISTPGSPGDSFISVNAVLGFTSVEFLEMRSDAQVYVRFGATSPVVSGGTAPAGSLSGTGLSFLFANADTGNGVPVAVSVSFTSETTMAQVVTAINAVANPLLGYSPAYIGTGGNLFIQGAGKGSRSYFSISGTAMTPLSLGSARVLIGQGRVTQVNGLCLLDLVQPNTQGPVGLEVSGIAKIQMVVAGQ